MTDKLLVELAADMCKSFGLAPVKAARLAGIFEYHIDKGVDGIVEGLEELHERKMRELENRGKWTAEGEVYFQSRRFGNYPTKTFKQFRENMNKTLNKSEYLYLR